MGTQLKKATFGAGCFWGVEAAFRRVPGVVDAAVGFEGGKTERPSYRDVCSHRTGHAETHGVDGRPGSRVEEPLDGELQRGELLARQRGVTHQAQGAAVSGRLEEGQVGLGAAHVAGEDDHFWVPA